MKIKLLITAALCLFVLQSQGQEFNGRVTYQSKTSFDMSRLPAQMSPEQKKRIMERMKSRLEQVYELDFNQTASVFKAQERLETPGQGGGRMRMFGGNSAGVNYKDLSTQEYYKEREITGKNFLIHDSLVQYNWQMTSETKMIGNYLAFKATAAVSVQNSPMMRFGRRPTPPSTPEKDSLSKGDVKTPKAPKTPEAPQTPEVPEVEFITAWYTLDIPVSTGPSDYWGLPGLILEVSQGNTTMLCTKVVLNPKDAPEIKAPKKGKEVSQEEFDKILSEKMQEMRENFSRRGGNGNRVIIRN